MHAAFVFSGTSRSQSGIGERAEKGLDHVCSRRNTLTEWRSSDPSTTKDTLRVESDVTINPHAGNRGDIGMCLLTWGQGMVIRTLSCGKLRSLHDPASARLPGVCTLFASRTRHVTIATGSSLCSSSLSRFVTANLFNRRGHLFSS